MVKGPFCVVLVTTPDRATSKRLAKGLVAQGLAACVNVLPGLTSYYNWEGRLEAAKEILLVIKTRTNLFPKLERFVRKEHPARVCEIIALPVLRGSKPYLDWVSAETRRPHVRRG